MHLYKIGANFVSANCEPWLLSWPMAQKKLPLENVMKSVPNISYIVALKVIVIDNCNYLINEVFTEP